MKQIFPVLLIISATFSNYRPGPSLQDARTDHDLKLIDFSLTDVSRSRIETVPVHHRDASVFAGRAPGPPSTSTHVRRHYEIIKYAIMTVRNDGTRIVKSVEWDFIFPHARGDRAFMRLPVKSKVKIHPGETKYLDRILPGRGRNPKERFGTMKKSEGLDITIYFPRLGVEFDVPPDWREGKGRITKVVFEDGSSWQID